MFPDQGSHPGPLSFYLLAPTYRLTGSAAWSLLAGMIVLNLVAIALALWLAHRRGGPRLTIAVAALIVVLVRGYGFDVVTQPWNPYLPLLFWLVVLLAVWGVLDGRQAHDRAGHRRRLAVRADPHAVPRAVPRAWAPCASRRWRGGHCGIRCERNETYRVLGTSAVVGLVLWSPPVYDQLTNDPGNLRMIADYFRNPPEDPVGTGEGLQLLLRHLNVFRIGTGAFGSDGYVTRAAFDLQGSVLPGLLVLLVWIGAAVLAWRIGHRALTTLNVVIGWALVLGADLDEPHLRQGLVLPHAVVVDHEHPARGVGGVDPRRRAAAPARCRSVRSGRGSPSGRCSPSWRSVPTVRSRSRRSVPACPSST